MKTRVTSFKKIFKNNGEKGQGVVGLLVFVVVFLLAVYIAIVLIKELIIPAITGS